MRVAAAIKPRYVHSDSNGFEILHRCWVDRVPYDESRYLMALQKRSAPLLKHAAQNTD